MRATLLFRITAILFLLFAAGHTFGFLTFKPPTQEGQAVLEAMSQVHFEVKGQIYSYGGFYRGFGLSCTMSMIFESFLAWHLGSMAKRNAGDTKWIGYAFFAWQLPSLVLAWMYFGIPPLILTMLVTVLIGAATFLSGTGQPSDPPAA